jgi:hypothetical protein
MKNPNYPTGNRTRNLLACRAVPQSIVPPLPHSYVCAIFRVQMYFFNSYLSRMHCSAKINSLEWRVRKCVRLKWFRIQFCGGTSEQTDKISSPVKSTRCLEKVYLFILIHTYCLLGSCKANTLGNKPQVRIGRIVNWGRFEGTID